MATPYYKTYLKSATANGLVNPSQLTQEILESSFTLAVESILEDSNGFTIYVKAAILTPNDTTLDEVVGNHSAIFELEADLVAIEGTERDTKGRPLTAKVKPSGLSDGTLVTHDLCDKSTWYQESTEHLGISLSNKSGNIYGHIDHIDWIDITNGKLYGEDNVENKRVPKIYVDGVEVNNYTIDFNKGEVTFSEAPSGVVTADFWKAGSSVFTITPTTGKILALEHCELQFSEDVVMDNPIRFEIWVYNPYYGVEGHPYEFMVKIPYKTIRYKNIKDIINAANLGQGYIPKISGLQNNILVFPFNYIATKPLASSLGAELRISIEGDQALAGEWGTATFYFLSEDE